MADLTTTLANFLDKLWSGLFAVQHPTNCMGTVTFVKTATGIPDNTPTVVLTITVPNVSLVAELIFHVLAIVALAVSQAEQPFLEDRILAVPER